jgi:hypothetical protein
MSHPAAVMFGLQRSPMRSPTTVVVEKSSA